MSQRLLAVLCFAMVVFAGAAKADRLGGFESDVTSPSSGGGGYSSSDESGGGEDCSPLFQDCTTEEDPFATKKVDRFPRVDSYTQLALRYHYAFLGVYSYDLQLDKVRGKYGVSARYDHYTEQGTSTTLGVAGIYLLYRAPATKQLQVDLGVGLGGLYGKQANTGLSLELPLKARLSEHVSLALFPAITYLANQMVQVNGALEVQGGRSIYSIGYKSLRGPTQRLEGPYLGYAYRW